MTYEVMNTHILSISVPVTHLFPFLVELQYMYIVKFQQLKRWKANTSPDEQADLPIVPIVTACLYGYYVMRLRIVQAL